MTIYYKSQSRQMVVLSIYSEKKFLYQQYKLFFPIGIYFFYFISNNNCRLLTTVQVFDIMFDNSAPPSCQRTKYFYAGIVQSNLCWKIHNKYVFYVNIHIFVLKYLVQIQIIQNQFKIPKEVNGTATKCRVYAVHEWLKITVFVLLESK